MALPVKTRGGRLLNLHHNLGRQPTWAGDESTLTPTGYKIGPTPLSPGPSSLGSPLGLWGGFWVGCVVWRVWRRWELVVSLSFWRSARVRPGGLPLRSRPSGGPPRGCPLGALPGWPPHPPSPPPFGSSISRPGLLGSSGGWGVRGRCECRLPVGVCLGAPGSRGEDTG